MIENLKPRQLPLAVVLLLILIMGLMTAVVCAQKTSRELLNEIDTYMRPVEGRDFPTILKKTEELCKLFPESDAADLMLDTIERWHSLGDVSDEQFDPFKQRLEAMRKQEREERTIAQNIGKRYDCLMSMEQLTTQTSQEMINACLDTLNKPDISRSLRCSVWMLLARVYFKTQQFEQFQKYADLLHDESKTSEGLDFSGGEGMAREIRVMELERTLDASGIETAVEFWRNHFALQAEPGDDSSESEITRISANYLLMCNLLYRTSGDGKDDTVIQRIIDILEEMIRNFPDSKHSGVLEGRLRLGRLVLNRGLSGDFLSGVLTHERINQIKLVEKANAEQAEKIFAEVRELGRGTPIEQSALKALAEVEQRKNPKLLSMEFDTFKYENAMPIAHASFTWRFWVLMALNAVCLAAFLAYLCRRKIVSFFKFFAIREGGRTVGSGVVTKILK